MHFADTYALVLCGGQSHRMGSDKSLLQYYDKPQRYHVYDMLMPLCEKVFISCNAQQAGTIEASYQCLPDHDSLGQIGPMGALLTAFTHYPGKNVLLVGCDYPFLKSSELELFTAQCNDKPVSFYNNEAAIYESMIAWYPSSCFTELKTMYASKEFSLQYLLRKTGAVKYVPTDKSTIISIDTREAYEQTCKQINAG